MSTITGVPELVAKHGLRHVDLLARTQGYLRMA